ncbi:MAG: CehA/McbA family metallohydrolase [Aestuariivita sp.]|nr:CehA/McbA family metallohydrolase [Aestuariivita sp.]
MHDPTFSSDGRFWRGNLHTHSNRSDGILDPEEVCLRYQSEGYDFIALTDHFIELYHYPVVDTTEYRGGGFTTILGAELHSGTMDNGELWHILAVGLPLDFAPTNTPEFRPIPDQESGPELAQRARKAGAFVTIAHPEWSGLTLHDAQSLEAAHAIEIYNHSCHVEADRGRGFWHLDRLLEKNHRLTICATDDAHFQYPDYFGGWTMVKSIENTPEALLQALKSGHMYASTGPEIYMVIWNDTEVIVECSAVTTIIVQGHKHTTKVKRGDTMTRATLPLSGLSDSPFLRLTVINKAGQRAWTNPVWKI